MQFVQATLDDSALAKVVSHILRAPANVVRRALIGSGLDRLLAGPLSKRPDGIAAKILRPDISLYRGSAVRRVERDGIRYELDPADYIEWTIYYGVERELKSSLYSLVEPGQTVLDIGTNVGEVLLHFGRRVGPRGRAIGFEPNPETLEKCLRNITLNPSPKVEIHGVALGDRPGEVMLGRPTAANAGADRVVTSGEGVRVPITTLDRFVEEQALTTVDLIKIDVEGFDLNVLRGAERTIELFRPILFVELSDSNLREQGESAAGLVKWLEEHRYFVADALTGDRVGSGDALDGCFRDVIARPTQARRGAPRRERGS